MGQGEAGVARAQKRTVNWNSMHLKSGGMSILTIIIVEQFQLVLFSFGALSPVFWNFSLSSRYSFLHAS